MTHHVLCLGDRRVQRGRGTPRIVQIDITLPSDYHLPMRIALQVHLDEDLLAWLRVEAGRRRCSMAQIIRDLILAKMSASSDHLARREASA